MTLDKRKDVILHKIKTKSKVDIFPYIWSTIQCSGPILYIIFGPILYDYKRRPGLYILGVISLIGILWLWHSYYKNKKAVKKIWEDSSLELNKEFELMTEEDLLELEEFYLQKESKVSLIFNISGKIAGYSLLALIINLIFTYLSKLEFMTYILLPLLVILMLSGLICIILGLVSIITLLIHVEKNKNFWVGLLKFIIISVAIFLFLAIPAFLIRGRIDFFRATLASVSISFSLYTYLESRKLAKEFDSLANEDNEEPIVESSNDVDSPNN